MLLDANLRAGPGLGAAILEQAPVGQVYEEQGVQLPNVRLLGPEGAAPGEIVVVPPQLGRSAVIAIMAKTKRSWAGSRGSRASASS